MPTTPRVYLRNNNNLLLIGVHVVKKHSLSAREIPTRTRSSFASKRETFALKISDADSLLQAFAPDPLHNKYSEVTAQQRFSPGKWDIGRTARLHSFNKQHTPTQNLILSFAPKAVLLSFSLRGGLLAYLETSRLTLYGTFVLCQSHPTRR